MVYYFMVQAKRRPTVHNYQALFFSLSLSQVLSLFFRFIIYYTINTINLYNTMSLSKDEFFVSKY